MSSTAWRSGSRERSCGRAHRRGQPGERGRDRVDVHLLERGAPVFDHPAGNDLSPRLRAVLALPCDSAIPTTTSAPRSDLL